MILYGSFLDELTKIAAAGYLLDQVGKPKLRPKTAMPPDEKFKVELPKPPKSAVHPSGAPSAQAPNAPPAPTAKVAFDVSQFSGELGGGTFFHPPFMPPFRVPNIYGKDPQLKESGSKTIDEKRAAAAATPAGQLAQSQREGQPKTTGFAGPSISDVSKPVGFGHALPGTAKNRI